jgi:exodeoxyribonuclease V alpha subunit
VRPDRLTALPGVGVVKADRLVTTFAAAAETYDTVEVLLAAGLPVRGAARVAQRIGPGAAAALRSDPWRLLDAAEAELGLAQADRLAAALGVRDEAARGRAVVGWLLVRAAREGHTALAAGRVAEQAAALGVGDPAAAIAAALDSGAVLADAGADTGPGDPGADAGTTDEGPEAGVTLLALERYALAESALAEGLARLVATAESLGDPAAVRAVAGDLDERQRAAVAQVLTSGVSLLTGGPGTGKSRTVEAVVRLLGARGRQVALAAPTGRAAKRLEELTGAPASTLHRLLGAQGTSGGFARGEDWPLDADVVVVDEVSMLDAELAAALVEACPDGTHLLLVGDPAQLPSIGAGRVLGDLVDAARLPVTELATLYRQAEGGTIARLATAVRGGTLPPVDDPDREVVVVPARGSAEAARRTVQLVTDSIPRALGIPAAQVQVVTPVHAGPAGTVALNAALKQVLNPGGGAHRGFDPGDRVVATANHLDAGFANGEVGVVVGPAGGGALRVAFAAADVEVPPEALVDLRHGWAITVHRAQGSEWPAVVVVLPPEGARMLSRPLVYTAITRAQRHLSVVHAVGPALSRAVAADGGRPRTTRLRALLGAELDGLDSGPG